MLGKTSPTAAFSAWYVDSMKGLLPYFLFHMRGAGRLGEEEH